MLALLEEFRCWALFPRPFVVGERFRHTDVPNRKEQLTAFVKEKRATVLVMRDPIESPAYAWLATHYGTPLAGSATFRTAARSPFNQGGWTGWVVTRLGIVRRHRYSPET
jgi:hypothetical protein